MSSGLAFGYDEIHQLPELLIRQQQFGIVGRTPHRVDTEEPPIANTHAPEQIADSRQVVDRALVDAGYYVPGQTLVRRAEPDSPARTLIGQRVLTQPHVVFLQPVQRYGQRTQTGLTQFAKTRFRQCQSVGHHAPRVTAVAERLSHLLEVLAHQRLAAGDDHHHLMRIHMRRHFPVYHAQEIFGRHIRCLDGRHAVAAAMQTVHIAAQRRFPEELLQRVHRLQVATPQVLQPESQSKSQSHYFSTVRG